MSATAIDYETPEAKYLKAALSFRLEEVAYTVLFEGRPTVASQRQPLHLLWRVTSSDDAFELAKPLVLGITASPEGFTVSSEELDVHGFGKTKDEAVQDFMDFFAGDFLNLRQAEARLDDKARDLLRRYESYVG